VMNMLNSEIISRYYFQRGRIMNKLKTDDKNLEKAVQVLKNNAEYKTLLKV
jgi:carboxyl-terminal processing protease